MNIYLMINTDNYNKYWEYYDSAVVCAKSTKDAVKIHPSDTDNYSLSDWCKPEIVTVTYIGEASPKQKRGVICSSFNAC